MRNEIAILKGVNESDQVVTSGQLKLKNASPVRINNEAYIQGTKISFYTKCGYYYHDCLYGS